MLRRFIRPSLPTAFEIDVEGRRIPIMVRQSARARRMSLRVRRAERDVVLTLPPRASLVMAENFAQRHGRWIAERVEQLPNVVPFSHGASIPLRGVLHRIEHRDSLRGLVEVLERDEPVIEVPGLIESLPRRMADFLRREARRDLEEAVTRHATKLGVKFGRISIKDTRSRWGSCSADGNFSFSWRLIMAPSYVLDYLAAHEVAHRREMNHSRRYWAVLRDLFPETDAAEAWLTAHGAELHCYGAAAGACDGPSTKGASTLRG
ncbi:metal-dependent hydrolase [Agaricicola taiwanensis]|uniref:Metal-dependent hydrolase n=1 Tax=Agaricicola taiwanensis TaxID=591372 RepID=A0A8J2VM83_9RHOB|nr:SprT family zinc-dependent metalloprotease [Agaricicola taiwanensis]GGE29905.1 metal-dependent hydrolase [Agaricicola taiwanensis]